MSKHITDAAAAYHAAADAAFAAQRADAAYYAAYYAAADAARAARDAEDAYYAAYHDAAVLVFVRVQPNDAEAE
jgi:hypothetical protein